MVKPSIYTGGFNNLTKKLDMELNKNLVGYARISSKWQKSNGSIELQKKILLANGVPSNQIIEDEYTGTEFGTPQLNELIRNLMPGQTLCTTSLDRLTRNPVFALHIISYLVKGNMEYWSLDKNKPFLFNQENVKEFLEEVFDAENFVKKSKLVTTAAIAKAKKKSSDKYKGRPRKIRGDAYGEFVKDLKAGKPRSFFYKKYSITRWTLSTRIK